MNARLREFLIENREEYFTTEQLRHLSNIGTKPGVSKELRELMSEELRKENPVYFFAGNGNGCICTKDKDVVQECISTQLKSALDRLTHVQDLQLLQYRLFTKNKPFVQLDLELV
jgi:hypothetical protein